MFKGFKPQGMQKIANKMNYQGSMENFDNYLEQNPEKKREMIVYEEAAKQMAKGGIVKLQAGGNVGAVLATLGEEIADAGSYAQSYYDGIGSLFDPAYYGKIFAQPTEDILANLQGIMYTTPGSSPQQKYEELLDLYSRSGAGIFTPALNRAIEDAEPGRVITQQNLIDAVRADRAARAQESREESREDYTGGGGTVVIGKGGGESKVVSPRSREAMYSPTPQRSSSRGPDLRRRATGGLVSLFGRF